MNILDSKHTIKYTYNNATSATHYGVSLLQIRHKQLQTRDNSTFLRPIKIELFLDKEYLDIFNDYIKSDFFSYYMHPKSSGKIELTLITSGE